MGTTTEAVGLGVFMRVFYNEEYNSQRTTQIL